MVGIDDTSTYGSEIDDNSDVDDTDDVMLREGIFFPIPALNGKSHEKYTFPFWPRPPAVS